MIYNAKDGIWYMTSTEFQADTELISKPTTKVYVYETGKIHVTDGTTWRELGAS